MGVLRRKAGKKVRKVRDDARRHDLEVLYFQADSLWEQAIEIGHGFRWDRWEAVIEESRNSFQILLEELEKKR